MIVRKSSKAWLESPEFSHVTVLDPDGWDRKDLTKSMSEEITKEEFLARLGHSTVQLRLL